MSAVVVPLQKPLVEGRPQMLPQPTDIPMRLNADHPAATIVDILARAHPRIMTRPQLRIASGHDGKEPRHSAVFEWLILRANDTLPLTGWKIDEDRERYRLAKIARKHHERLLEQHR